jgi:hypothetical protein
VNVNVPFAQIPGTGFCGRALQVSVPPITAPDSATPLTFVSFAITPLDTSDTTSGMQEDAVLAQAGTAL